MKQQVDLLPYVPARPDDRNDRTFDLVDFLASHGLVARNPAPIRSSEYEDWRKDPFYYYLKHRLGISPIFANSEALELGSWFHVGMEASLLGQDEDQRQRLIDARMERAVLEIKERGAAADVRSTTLDRIIYDTKQIARTALLWQSLAWQLKPVPPQYKVVDVEPLVVVPASFVGKRVEGWKAPIVARFDAILYNERRNEIWIQDTKTTTPPPYVRMATIPWEFQARLYRLAATYLNEIGVFQTLYGLPKDAKLVGMMHYMVQKPTIRVYKNDLKAEEMGKQPPGYAFDRYLERTRDWFLAEGEWIDQKMVREKTPAIDLSMVRWGNSPVLPWEFRIQLMEANYAASCKPVPDNFPRSSSFIREFGVYKDSQTGLSPYTPFYMDEVDVRDWPRIVAEDFVVQFRDWPLPKNPITRTL